MLFSLISLTAALGGQAALERSAPPAAAPPPLIVATSPPAPPPARASDLNAKPVTLDLHISASEGPLWEGALRVSPQAGASVSQSRSEASAENCASADYRDRNLRTNFNININAFRGHRGPEETEAFNVNVNWSRPTTADGCAREGSRSVQLQQMVEVDPGGSVTLRGDAGLIVRIRRR